MLGHDRAIVLSASMDISPHTCSALILYIEFCDMYGFSVEPTEDTFSFFAVWLCRSQMSPVRPDTVSSYLSAISSQLESFYPNARHVRFSTLVTRTLEGCELMYRRPSTRNLPLSACDIVRKLQGFPENPNHDLLLFRAILLTAWNGLLGLFEILEPDNVKDRDIWQLPHRDNIHWIGDDDGFQLDLAYPPSEHTRVNIKRHPFIDAGVDPYQAFVAYLRSRDDLFPLHWELWLCEDGSVPTASWFKKHFRPWFPNNSLSIRTGGALALASVGVSADVIQKIGRWSLKEFQCFVRKNPAILAALLFPYKDRGSSVYASASASM
ncbi:tyrosine recombinase [Moniliophthora roreri MCA 2997]|uniref:Tyrosine recombinase n=1 Tax=Moniliophthora roreri (strain MCA 2997) TaxID=1381753 RepID=V2XKT2_MONRO|nr:tyrosine recombinase [Moniliophthora roreri MCA 2997]